MNTISIQPDHARWYHSSFTNFYCVPINHVTLITDFSVVSIIKIPINTYVFRIVYTEEKMTCKTRILHSQPTLYQAMAF